MSRFLKVEGFENIVRDTSSNAIISNSKTEYQIYMQRAKNREKQGDQIRNAVKEINNLKNELREIKDLIKGKLGKAQSSAKWNLILIKNERIFIKMY